MLKTTLHPKSRQTVRRTLEFQATSVSWPMTPSQWSPMRRRMIGIESMSSDLEQISTLQLAEVRHLSQRSPGRAFVTRTRVSPLGLCT